MERLPQESKPGDEFEGEVAEILHLRGFSVQRDFRSDGFRADFIVSRGQDPFREIYLVEAKDQKTPVGNEHVLKLGGAVNAYQRSYPGILGLLVSRTGFTADAKKAASSQANIRLATLEQLIDGLIDFTSYLRQYASEYQGRAIFELFVDPGYFQGSATAEEENESLVTFLLKWARRRTGPRNLLLLGEYGLGKTVAVENFCFRLATEIISGSTNLPVPVVIYLKDFTKALHDLRYLITSHLVNELNTDGRFNAFLKLLRRGRIVLILDGFDEMAMAVDEDTRDHNFLLLQTLCQGGARVIITGRPEYFPSEQHLIDLISEERHLSPSAHILLGETGELPQFAKLYVAPFNQLRINAFLSLYEKYSSKEIGFNSAVIGRQIRETYDLKSLASRPVLLDLIVKTLPRMTDKSGPVTAARLYDLYTRFWLEREEQKGRRLIPREVKQAFVYELAWKMATAGKYSIHFAELPLEIIGFFNPVTEKDWEAYDHDIRACSYLHRDESGRFSFAHKTFMEFFCASRIYHELQYGKSNPLSKIRITSEIMAFFADLSDGVTIDALTAMVYTYSNIKLFRDNLLRFLSRITLAKGLRCYIHCLVFFPSREAISLDRQLRQRMERLEQSEREELIVQVFDIQTRDPVSGSEKATSRILSLLKVDEFLVVEYAYFLEGGRKQYSYFGDRVEALERLRSAVEALGGFLKLWESLQRPEISIAEDVLEEWERKTNASPRLCREIVQKFELSPDGALDLLKELKLRKRIDPTMNETVRARNVDLLARDIRLSPAAAGEILTKSKLERNEIKSALKQIVVRKRTSYMDDLRRLAGLNNEVFRSTFPLLVAAAKRARLIP